MGVIILKVSYEKLFKKLKEQEIKEKEFQIMAGFSGNIMTRMRRNQYVSLESIQSVCHVLDCKVEDVLDFIND